MGFYYAPSFPGSPGLPSIYISFEKTVDGDSTMTPYNRGKDKNSNSKVRMVNGANIGTSAGRPGKVLKMTGTNAGADAGYFRGHNIKYVKSLLVLQNFSTARKSGNISHMLKAIFVRHSSEY